MESDPSAEKKVDSCDRRLHHPWRLKFFFLISLLLFTSTTYGAPVGPLTPAEVKMDAFRAETFEIDPRFEPRDSLYQLDTPTCFGHSATFNLQYLINSQSGGASTSLSTDETSSAEQTPVNLSVIDVIARGSDLEFPDQGTPSTLLHRLKGQTLWQERDLEIDEIWKFKTAFLNEKPANTKKIKSKKYIARLIEGTLPASLKSSFPEWKTHLKVFLNSPEAQLQDLSHFYRIPYLYLNSLVKAETITLPHYNLHVFDTSSDDLIHLSQDIPQNDGLTPHQKQNESGSPVSLSLKTSDLESREETLIPAVHKWFQSRQNHAVPLTFSFCTSEHTTSPECGELHAANLVGSSKECDGDGRCSYFWRIRNSTVSSEEGWFQAKPLAKATLKRKTEMSYLVPCSDLPSQTMETCSSGILGFTLAHSPLPPFFASNPLHNLAHAGDATAFLEQVDQLKALGTLENELAKTSDFEKSLTHRAVEGQSKEILRWLKTHAPDVLKKSSSIIGNSAHYAVFRNQPDTIRALFEHEPALFLTSDRHGLFPSDYAAIQGNLEALIELHSLDPKLLSTRNGRGASPLETLRQDHPEIYSDFKKRAQKVLGASRITQLSQNFFDFFRFLGWRRN